MAPSPLAQFESSLDSYGTLLLVESCFPDPPEVVSADLQYGLRGAVAVLPVAAFQDFLEKEFLMQFGGMRSRLVADKAVQFLEPSVLLSWYRTSLEYASVGDRSEGKTGPEVRVGKVVAAAGKIDGDDLDLYAMSRMSDNPDSAGVNRFFKRAGVSEIIGKAEFTFFQHWPKAESTSFLADKLDEIVNRRHGVAHTGDLGKLTRQDLEDGLLFFRCLGRALDTALSVETLRMSQAAISAALAAAKAAGTT